MDFLISPERHGRVFARVRFVEMGACLSIVLLSVVLNASHASSTVNDLSISSQEAECKSLENCSAV